MHRIVAVLIIAVGMVMAVGAYGLRPVAEGGGTTTILIKPGEGLKEISEKLFRENLIRSPAFFKLWGAGTLDAHKLKPGVFTVSRASSTPEIFRLLKGEGSSAQVVLIPEGESLREIEERLLALHIIEKGELSKFSWGELKEEYPFLRGAKSLEGFLFPDTYHFSFYTPVEIVVREFLENFKEKAWPLLEKESNFYTTLITASLLEEEVRGLEEQRLVAGIIEKRIRNSMPIQIDATVLYAKCSAVPAEEVCGALLRSDFSLDSPYNSYREKGLPPTPISNPGVNAIQAAQNPRASSYWYYLTDPKTGKALFSETFEEHTDKRARYLGL